jgi:hypothetical protein
MKTLDHSEFEADFHNVENCNVNDNNGDETFVGNLIDSYSFSDGQDSVHMREYDNEKTAYMDYHGCCYVSGISMSEEIRCQLEQIIDNNGVTDNFIFDKESLLDKFPEHAGIIQKCENILVGNKQYSVYTDDNNVDFLFEEVAEKVSFTSDNGQDSVHFHILKEGILHCDRHGKTCFLEINLKDAILYAIEGTDVESLAEQMQAYVDEYLRD